MTGFVANQGSKMTPGRTVSVIDLGRLESATVSAVDAATLRVVRTVAVGSGPEHVEVAPERRWVVVSRPEAGELVVLETGSLTAVRRIAVGEEPHQIAFAGR